MDLETRIRASFGRQSMMQTLGARLISVAPGAVTIEAAIRPDLHQQLGYAHAALAFAIGDSAAGYSALTVTPEDKEIVTSEMKIHLLAPAVGDRLIARGRVIRPGRRLVIVSADVYAVKDGRETHAALLTGTTVPV
ncbi:PaaI family thioesterase [Salipiger sp. P9]|uniref:PaaI family thioesterase n=1 Tax=Salipiger pentaromativorans TaxID=2943193 RepID=UPI002157CBE8|nr:PaaI family thioesterase [Salipiger pentaromativorans]MCR8549342.1 PaaI family thioesterase [Salipiger pentaromativorans]